MRVWMRKSDAQLGVALNDWWDGWMCTIGSGFYSSNPADFIDMGDL